MYWARAVGRLARKLGSDLLGGLVYAKEEIEDWDEDGYGGGSGYEATTAKVFDPETDLMPGAISGENALTRLRGALDGIDPTVDWSRVVADVVLAKYDTATVKDLKPKEFQDFCRRLSNTVQWIFENSDSGGDFPPVDAETIQKGFAYAFSGNAVEVTYLAIEDAEIEEPTEKTPLDAEAAAKVDEALQKEDDVPFGEEKK
jgi:hypothetical protein